jgi:hypothetical protein
MDKRLRGNNAERVLEKTAGHAQACPREKCVERSLNISA